MADSLFEFVAARFQELTSLDQLETRGTVRIALKEAGLDARSVTREQMSVMLEKTMPKELVARGVDGAEDVCRSVLDSLAGFDGGAGPSTESPEDVFRRLGAR